MLHYTSLYTVYTYTRSRERDIFIYTVKYTHTYECINTNTRHLKKEAKGHDKSSSPTKQHLRSTPVLPRFREKSVVMSTEAPLGIGERGLELQNSMVKSPKFHWIKFRDGKKKIKLQKHVHKMKSCHRNRKFIGCIVSNDEPEPST